MAFLVNLDCDVFENIISVSKCLELRLLQYLLISDDWAQSEAELFVFSSVTLIVQHQRGLVIRPWLPPRLTSGDLTLLSVFQPSELALEAQLTLEVLTSGGPSFPPW